ncbi:MAG: ABC transporter ATP-binding protein [Thermoplasmata archaeon]|nr:ABC transporter ATP-binding protein [Thermoplasmata archaeon]
MEYVIQTENLVKKYNRDITALNGISIKIKRGDVVGYVGPNGSGKTTTIKILTNLLAPTSGQAYINGLDVNKNPKAALHSVGALIEVPGVYDYLTPHEILTYFGKIYGMNKKDIDQRIKEVLKLVKLTAWEHKKISSFSTGMQRRLGIAKAILHNPEILILDEPAIGLDPKGIKDVRELIKQFQRDNITVFLSSHLLQEVSETCNSILFLDNGKVVISDSMENIKSRVELKMIDVKFLSPLLKEDLVKIGAIEGVDALEKINEHLRLHFDGKPHTSFQILSKLFSYGYKVVAFTPVAMGLEDFYINVVGDERGVS